MKTKHYILSALLLAGFNVQPAFADQIINCESLENRQSFCRVRNIQNKDVELVRRHSKADCREGDSWGVARDGIWVSRGCRADFKVSAYNDYSRDYSSDYSNERWKGRNRGRYKHGYHPGRGHGKFDYRGRNEGRGLHGRRNYGNGDSRGYRESERFSVNRAIRSNTSWVGPRIDQQRVHQVRVLVRRLNPAERDAHVSVGFDDNQQFGSQQVDSERLHWLQFDTNNIDPRSRRVVVTSHSGTVFVDSVIVQ